MKSYIGYITRDEVNAALARSVALPDDVLVIDADSEQGLPNSQRLGLVYDLDHLWPADRRSLLRRLRKAPALEPVAVHSYDLSSEQTAVLLAQGVDVFHQLDDNVFQRLLVDEPLEAAKIAAISRHDAAREKTTDAICSSNSSADSPQKARAGSVITLADSLEFQGGLGSALAPPVGEGLFDVVPQTHQEIQP